MGGVPDCPVGQVGGVVVGVVVGGVVVGGVVVGGAEPTVTVTDEEADAVYREVPLKAAVS